jgi:hypothetical protein
MARLMRAFDWSTSEVGVPEKWPESLKAAVRICVGSRNPIVIWWGRTALTQILTNRLEFLASSPGEKTMRRYHHIGIPTTESKPGETHLKHLKVFVVSHQKSEFGVEWMRFEAGAAIPDLVRRVAHVAFEVTDLCSELAGREILIPPNSPSDGVRVAFIVENGAPIELLEFTDPKHPARGSDQTDE